jgi:carboxyl-terminal processing protease
MNLKTHSKTFAVAAVLVASASLTRDNVTRVGAASSHFFRPPACQLVPDTPPDPSGPSDPPELTPTTITTIGQVYYCILDNYYKGPVLDDRSLLIPAFAGLTQELQRRGLDQSMATLPALTGTKHDDDWAAFSQIYKRIDDKLPHDPAVRQAVAEATMRVMVGSLNDNHVEWLRSGLSANPNLSGMSLSAVAGPGQVDPVATEPLFVTDATGTAESAGIRPGDEILAVNGVPPFINGVLSLGVLNWITQIRTDMPIELVLHRPATDATFTVTVTPGSSQMPPGLPPPPLGGNDAKLVGGNIAYVKMQTFGPGSSDIVLAAITELRKTTNVRGVILDVRGNGGGYREETWRLLGALAHDKVVSYWCDGKDHCKAKRTDDSVELLNLPLVVLTDRKCASACDSFTSSVKDLHLGILMGTRTAGRVSGPAHFYLLSDGSVISLPSFYEIAANEESVNTIGVAPDYYAPLTALDLSIGRDPALAWALELLR